MKSKNFWNKEKANLLIPKSSRLKRNKERFLKTFRNKKEQKDLFQIFEEAKRNNKGYS